MENPEKDHPGVTVTSKPSTPDEARIAKINADAGSTKEPYNSLSDIKPNLVATPTGRQFGIAHKPA